MALETPVTFINTLEPLNPVSGDPVQDGDNHIRNIKAAIKATFANITAAVTATAVDLNKLVGMTSSTVELNKLTGVTSTPAELNKLSGVTVTPTEVNRLAGVTSAIQTQLNTHTTNISGITPASLGLAIGVNVQAFDSDLNSLGAITRNRGDIIRGGASGWEDLPLGQSGQHLVSNGTDVVYSGGEQGPTTVAGTSISFAAIPTGVNRVEVIFSLVTLTAAADVLVQIGTAGTPEITAYDSASARLSGGVLINVGAVNGFLISSTSSALTGVMYLERIPGSNKWVNSHSVSRGGATGGAAVGGGEKTIAGVLDIIRIATSTGTTFSGGNVSIRWRM